MRFEHVWTDIGFKGVAVLLVCDDASIFPIQVNFNNAYVKA